MPNGTELYDKEALLPDMIEYISEMVLSEDFPLEDIGEMRTLIKHMKSLYVQYAFKRRQNNLPSNTSLRGF